MNPETTFTALAAHAGSSEGPHAPVAEVTPEYVAFLQTTLQVYREQLAQSQAALTMIQASRGWRLVRLCYRVRDRLLPVSTRRRRVVMWMLDEVLMKWIPERSVNGLIWPI